MLCEHLRKVDDYLSAKQIPEYYRGQAWSDNCREWVYYDCILDTEELKRKFDLPGCVHTHEYIDPKVANELGLVCSACHDGIMGYHPGSEASAHKLLVG